MKRPLTQLQRDASLGLSRDLDELLTRLYAEEEDQGAGQPMFGGPGAAARLQPLAPQLQRQPSWGAGSDADSLSSGGDVDGDYQHPDDMQMSPFDMDDFSDDLLVHPDDLDDFEDDLEDDMQLTSPQPQATTAYAPPVSGFLQHAQIPVGDEPLQWPSLTLPDNTSACVLAGSDRALSFSGFMDLLPAGSLPADLPDNLQHMFSDSLPDASPAGAFNSNLDATGSLALPGLRNMGSFLNPMQLGSLLPHQFSASLNAAGSLAPGFSLGSPWFIADAPAGAHAGSGIITSAATGMGLTQGPDTRHQGQDAGQPGLGQQQQAGTGQTATAQAAGSRQLASNVLCVTPGCKRRRQLASDGTFTMCRHHMLAAGNTPARPMCEVKGCERYARMSAEPGATRRFCAKHMQAAGLQPLASGPMCRHPNCTKLAQTSTTGERTYCPLHMEHYGQKPEGVVCGHVGCSRMATFSSSGVCQYCVWHMREHGLQPMARFVACEEPGCRRQSTLSVTGVRRYCRAHMAAHGLQPMVDTPCRVEGCTRQAMRGTDAGGAASGLCRVHARAAGIKLRGNATCAHDGCQKVAQYSTTGVRLYCDGHMRAHGQQPRPSMACSHPGCVASGRLAADGGAAFCKQHMQAAGLVAAPSNRKRCTQDGCSRFAKRSDNGEWSFCKNHMRAHGLAPANSGALAAGISSSAPAMGNGFTASLTPTPTNDENNGQPGGNSHDDSNNSQYNNDNKGIARAAVTAGRDVAMQAGGPISYPVNVSSQLAPSESSGGGGASSDHEAGQGGRRSAPVPQGAHVKQESPGPMQPMHASVSVSGLSLLNWSPPAFSSPASNPASQATTAPALAYPTGRTHTAFASASGAGASTVHHNPGEDTASHAAAAHSARGWEATGKQDSRPASRAPVVTVVKREPARAVTPPPSTAAGSRASKQAADTAAPTPAAATGNGHGSQGGANTAGRGGGGHKGNTTARGGEQRQRCQHPGCTELGYKANDGTSWYCKTHLADHSLRAAPSAQRRCHKEGCTKWAKRSTTGCSLYCKAHMKEEGLTPTSSVKRCAHPGCTHAAKPDTNGKWLYCKGHMQQYGMWPRDYKSQPGQPSKRARVSAPTAIKTSTVPATATAAPTTAAGSSQPPTPPASAQVPAATAARGSTPGTAAAGYVALPPAAPLNTGLSPVHPGLSPTHASMDPLAGLMQGGLGIPPQGALNSQAALNGYLAVAGAIRPGAGRGPPQSDQLLGGLGALSPDGLGLLGPSSWLLPGPQATASATPQAARQPFPTLPLPNPSILMQANAPMMFGMPGREAGAGVAANSLYNRY